MFYVLLDCSYSDCCLIVYLLNFCHFALLDFEQSVSFLHLLTRLLSILFEELDEVFDVIVK